MLFQRQGYSGGEEKRAVPGVGQGVQGAGERVGFQDSTPLIHCT